MNEIAIIFIPDGQGRCLHMEAIDLDAQPSSLAPSGWTTFPSPHAVTRFFQAVIGLTRTIPSAYTGPSG